MLTANPDLKGLFAANEASDVGAVEAVRIAHRVGKVKIVGWDTSPDEVDGVKQGIVSGLISQDPFRMGYDGVRAAVELLRHQGRPKSENTGAVMVTRSDLNNPTRASVRHAAVRIAASGGRWLKRRGSMPISTSGTSARSSTGG